MSWRRQRDRDPKTGLLDLLVYHEVPEGHRIYYNFIKPHHALDGQNSSRKMCNYN